MVYQRLCVSLISWRTLIFFRGFVSVDGKFSIPNQSDPAEAACPIPLDSAFAVLQAYDDKQGVSSRRVRHFSSPGTPLATPTLLRPSRALLMDVHEVFETEKEKTQNLYVSLNIQCH